MSKILFVGAEAMPFAATGGLGDVLGSLPAALKKADPESDIRVVMPLYGAISDTWRSQMKEEAVFELNLAWRRIYCGIKSLVKDGVTYYFIDNEHYFRRDTLYGNYDDGERYAYFCMAALSMLEQVGFYPDVLHAHDWQAALSIVYLNCYFRGRYGYGGIKTVFTIHNIEYQGQYGFEILGDVFALGENARSILEYDGCINLMKGAIVCADIVSTVSPTYAQEIRYPWFSHKLDHIINQNAHKLRGILNGIDYTYYDPMNDSVLSTHYSSKSVGRKSSNKLELQEALGLPIGGDIPMLAIITRLATHKGLDIVTHITDRLLAETGVQLVVLGKGEYCYESHFRGLEERYPNQMRALIQYDRDLSKRIYAASDIFIMPSRSEPCGLSQMIASRYGSIPVVRETGGLYDSIKGYYEVDGELYGNGFTFANYSADELYDRILAAVALYNDKEKRGRFVKKIMEVDFSWESSAKQYMDMYRSIL